MLTAVGENITKLFESSPELASKFKNVGSLIAWNMLENSNRLTKDGAIKASLEDF